MDSEGVFRFDGVLDTFGFEIFGRATDRAVDVASESSFDILDGVVVGCDEFRIFGSGKVNEEESFAKVLEAVWSKTEKVMPNVG